jgi:hypothetical protein
MRRTILFLALVTVSVAQDKLILSAAPSSKAKQTGCAVQELYAIAWSTHNPAERHKAMLECLDRTKCSADDYVTIWNALPVWAGTSDSPALRAKVMEKAR